MLRHISGKEPVSNVAERLKEHCKELYKHGWKKLTMEYSGSGDSCESFEILLHNEEGETELKNVENPPPTFMKEVENELWELLPSGFENNEGGQGTITVNIKTGRIVVEHDQFYIESNHTKEVY